MGQRSVSLQRKGFIYSREYSRIINSKKKKKEKKKISIYHVWMRSDQCLNITYLNVLLVFYLRHWYLMHLKIDHRLLFPLVEIFVCKETGGRRTDKRERERERERERDERAKERVRENELIIID